MFDTVLGLPVHALVVHGVVVLLPLMAIVTVWWAWRPESSAWLGWAVVAADAVVAVMALVARQSGEALQRRISGATGAPVAVEHGEIATVLPWLALALLVAAVLVQLLRRGDAGMPGRVTAAATAVIALVVVVWTVRAGHSGTTAVWGEVVKNTGK